MPSCTPCAHLIVSSFLLALLALAPARLVAAAPLRMLVLANSAMPLAEIKDAQVQGGLLKDIGELIAREADMPLNLTVMPRNRIAETLERRQADIYCDTLPEWLPATLKDLHWSAPVSWNPQYLVSAAPRRAPERWSQLKGSTVVTLLGYEYPKPAELARGFAEGQWQRSDAISEELLLRRLQLGRGGLRHRRRAGAELRTRASMSASPSSPNRPAASWSRVPASRWRRCCGPSSASRTKASCNACRCATVPIIDPSIYPFISFLEHMAKFLLAWELGDGLGHAARIKPLAQALLDRGHGCTLMLRDLVQPAQILSGLDAPRLQAPTWQHQTMGLPQPLASPPEILLSQGYLLAAHLKALAEGWLAAFQLQGTEAVIADYAPTAVLAARIAGLPCATIGIGFCIPPDVQPLPSFRPDLAIPQARLIDGERTVLANVNAVLAAHGKPPMARLHEIYAGQQPMLCTWPELDHYRRGDTGQAWYGPNFLAEVGGEVPPWPDGAGPRVFAYLKGGHPEHGAWLQALVDKGCRVICYLPEVAAGKPAPVRSPRLHYAARPVSLGAVLPDCDLLVCHAGEATLTQGLLAGVPLLLLPMQAEQALLARVAAANTGAALNAAELPRPAPMAAALGRLLDDPAMRQQARAFAARYRGFSHEEQTRRMADQFEALLGP